MSRVTVSFTADSVSSEQDARDLIDGISYDASTRGIRDLTVVSVSAPVTFTDQAAFEAAAREWLSAHGESARQ